MPSIAMYSSEGYDFNSEENAKKWRGLFITALRQILKNTHPNLISKQESLNYVESLLFRLLNMIITSPNNAVGSSTSTSITFHHLPDLEERIKRLFPTPLKEWAIKKAHEILSQLKNHRKRKISNADKMPLKTPVDKFHQLLQKEVLGHKVDIQVSQYILAVLEYIATDILQRSCHYVRNMTHTEITCQDIRVAMCADKVLMDLFYGDVEEVFGPPPSAGYHHHHQTSFLFESDATDNEFGKPTNDTERMAQYMDAVKELIREEQQFIRDLNLIIKVFRDPLTSVLDEKDLEKIFGNIDDILEFSNTFVFSLEDAIEICEEELPSIATCLEEFAEEQEFDVFEKYANDVSSFHLREHLCQLLSTPEISSRLLKTFNAPMLSALRYVLPQLLLVPVYHCFSYIKAISNFKELSIDIPKLEEERNSFEQAEALMLPVKNQLEKTLSKLSKFGESYFLRTGSRTSRPKALAKMSEIQRSIDGWEGKDIGQSCNEFIMEGPLSKVSGIGIGHRSTRLTERQAFLFDGLIVLCKPNTKRSTMSAVTGRDTSASNCDWRLKERFLIRNIEIVDKLDDLDRNSNFYLPIGNNTNNGTSTNTSVTSTTTITTTSTTNAVQGGGGDQSLSSLSSDTQSVTTSVSNLSMVGSYPGSSNFAGTNDSFTNHNMRYAFVIKPRNQNHIVLVTKTPEEKERWISQLTLLNTRSMLDRILDSRLNEEAKKHPLQLPHPSAYRFATEDFDTNIIFEDRTNPTSNVPLIKGATLLKLIERLTYHEYGDTPLIRTFLTTYRSFCTPVELLKLLIERFEIPNPDFISCMQAMSFANDELASPTNCGPELIHGHDNDVVVANGIESITPNTTGPTSPISPTQSMLDSNLNFNFPDVHEEHDNGQRERDYREMLKKFRKDYAQPVQVRVINVLRHWIENHFYDFERDKSLLDSLNEFLESKKTAPRHIRKLIQHLLAMIQRKRDPPITENKTIHNASKLQHIEWHLTRNKDEFDLLTLHPVEIARQLTLLESDLYRAVKPSELVGIEGQAGVWTKKDKQKTSPNLLKLIRHNTNFIFYLEKCIVEAENFEERTAIMQRIIEIMVVLQELNNFNGVLEVVSAMNSASVHRLEHTVNYIFEKNNKLKKAFDEAKELSPDHYRKYHEKLRSINPPCVPFFGIYLTNIVHLEEGNPEYLSPPNHLENMSLHDNSGILSDEAVNCKLINFSKKRKVAEITCEIQNYQNLQYCLMLEPSIRHFLENLSPMGDMDENEFGIYLFNKSLEIEPRGSKAPVKMPRRWPDRSLKSPGLNLKARIDRSLRFAHIPSLPSIDPLISNFTNSLSGNHSREASGHHSGHSAPNSANSNAGEMDNISLMKQQISPSTPLTPPQSATSHHHNHNHNHHHHHHQHHHHSSLINDPIFAPVMIGGVSSGCGNQSCASPTTPIHSTQRFFPSHPCTSLPPPPPPHLPMSSNQSSSFSPLSNDNFSLTPPPLPPRTNRLHNARNRIHPPSYNGTTRDNENDNGTSSPISNSPPPLPPRSHSVGIHVGHVATVSRSTSMQSYRETPPPIPPFPHPGPSSSHHSHQTTVPFIHQRVNSDITLGTSSSTNSNNPNSIMRRNSTLEPTLSRRYSQGNPPQPLPSVPSSPLHHSPLTPLSPSSSIGNHPPPPLSSPSATLSSPGGNNNSTTSPVPELPPKTYRLSNVCR